MTLMQVSLVAVGAALAVIVVGQATTDEEQLRISRLNNITVSNVKQIGTGMLIYQADYDDVNSRARKWVDNLMPYIKNSGILVNPWRPNVKHGYAMNAQMAGLNVTSVGRPGSVIMFFTTSQNTSHPVGGKKQVWKPKDRQRGAFSRVDGSARGYGAMDDVGAWSPKTK